MRRSLLALALILSGCSGLPLSYSSENRPQYYSQTEGQAPGGSTYPMYHPEELTHCWPPHYVAVTACTEPLPGPGYVQPDSNDDAWIRWMAGIDGGDDEQ